MSLRIIYGRAGAGKTRFVQDEIVEELKRQADGEPIFLIVPDQMSFSTEYRLAASYGMNGMIRAQAITFKRLAWRVLQEVGGISRKEVDTFGYRMLIRSLLEEHRDDFQLFRRAAGKRGFTDQIEQLVKEFARYCVDCGELSSIRSSLAEAGAPKTLLDKAEDLELILTEIENRLGKVFVDSEGHLALLSEKIPYSDLVKTTTIYIDGFVTFTAREYEILFELMKHAKSVTIALPMDEQTDPNDEQALFYQSANTARRLSEEAAKEGIEIENPVHLALPRRFAQPELEHIERHFDDYPLPKIQGHGHVSLVESSNRRAEMHAVARRIRDQARNGLRYSEIAILYRQPEIYDELINTIFPQYDIPYFISQKKSMLHHPLIEFSRSVLESVVSNYSYESVFRAVKTDLFFPLGPVSKWRERSDVLENFVIANGIYGERWFEEKRWFYKKYRGLEFHTSIQTDEELAAQMELHAVRDLIRDPLAELKEHLKHAKTGKDVAEALFLFIEKMDVYAKIQALREREENEHRLLAATEHEQAWNQWIGVLDQFVLMFGDKEIDLATAVKILDEGFETLEFSRIPPSLDQVTVSKIDLARLMDIKSVFVIGANDGVLPKRIEQEGILTDTDRDWFAQIGFELAPTSKMRLMDETYMVYRAFTSASDLLTVSFPIADEEGKALLPSLYIQKLKDMLSIDLIPAVIDPEELMDASPMAYISHPRATLAYLTSQIRSGDLTAEWRAVLDYYREDPFWSSVIERILAPIKPNTADPLRQDIAEPLYGSPISSSVSRVETYYSCPFAHYVTYGLRLEERSQYKLAAPAMGDLFHAAIKWISDEVLRLGVSWSSLTRTQCQNLAKEAIEQLSPYFVNHILISSHRYRYIQHKLEGIIRQTAFMLSKHAKVSGFVPVALEVGFGPQETIPPLDIPLNNGRKMNVRGRIDRIDSTEIHGKPYLRVVDYKSSKQGLDLSNVYHGLSLQTFTYLDVALTHSDRWLGKRAEPAGVLYFHMHNPMLKLTKLMTAEELEEEMAKSFKMNGLVVEDPEVIQAMDDGIEGYSNVIPVRLNKSGTVSASQSKTVVKEDMQAIRRFVRGKHQHAGNGILEGNTSITPYKVKEDTPCQFCSYRSVCQFDPADPEQSYRKLPALSPDKAVELIRKEAADDDTEKTE
ncbi:ATP-dependent helicase/nuclease subunit B [Planomicrobium stackebrandtii]|uniref:ATP-dependent helicase/deoxyribonuclease subunit B n=1 Tax=Planomicrobium stackebrandtii TaxID=253160 RepID=A0ABU0GVV2_9BACL|nr:helicase-exonuclease AddAB subunit AddB [Planomicrobium stackebrandtii]MDQ0429039.1 ATP-dependent helicase/nuclease subunit B [Planomicrobium stackebrandtii]